MAKTSFSGPILVGPITDTTGTSLGSNVANVGYVEMVQTQKVLQSSPNTTIVLPAGSQITTMNLYVTTVWDGAATTLGVGNTALATAYTAAGAVAGGTIGIVAVTPGTDATRTAAFVDVGATDVKIAVTSTNTGNGVGFLSVRYVQSNNLVV